MASPVIKTRCQAWPGCPPTCQREAQTWLRNNPEDKGRAGQLGRGPVRVHKELICYLQGVTEPSAPVTGQGTEQRGGPGPRASGTRSPKNSPWHKTGTAWLTGQADAGDVSPAEAGLRLQNSPCFPHCPQTSWTRDLHGFTVFWKQIMRKLNLKP